MATLQAIGEILEWMSLQLETGVAVDLDRARDMMLAVISRVVTMPAQEASEILKLLKPSAFDVQARQVLAQAVNGKVVTMPRGGIGHARPVATPAFGGTVDDAGGRKSGQTCLFAHRFMIKAVWDTFRDPNSSWESNGMAAVAKRLDQLGLVVGIETKSCFRVYGVAGDCDCCW